MPTAWRAPARYRDDPRAIALDRLSVAEYLDAIGATGWLRTLIAVSFCGEFGLDCDQLSAINLLTMISTDIAQGRLALFDSDGAT